MESIERFDPWGHVLIDYHKLFSVFGVEPMKNLLPKLEQLGPLHRLYRRGVVFAHRDFDKIVRALKNGEKVAVVTGFMPSGPFHFGHKMVADQVTYLQSLGAKPFIVIADAEAYAVRGLPRSKIIEYAKIYVANLIALGVDPERATFYMQTNYREPYYRLIQMASAKATLAEMTAIYGDLDPGKIMAVLTQVADILHPQLDDFGGYKHVVVPVGPDQDPHIRFTRDVADRLSGELGTRKPASTYHRLMRGIDGSGKMSSSRPESYISLNDPVDVAVRKLMNAYTGGRATAEEQRRLGGEPEKCAVYELYLYHLADDDLLKRVYNDCKAGRLLCGADKQIASKLLREFLEEHQKRFKEVYDTVEDYIKLPSF
ncbi:tryptophan--tRNA ligase [Stetteria hydrogenophila]